MTRTAYVTTPIYYPSGKPHLGSAYTSLAADVYARFKRLDGFDTYFLTGTDEHGLKIQRAAEKEGLTPQAFVDKMAADFKQLTPMMGLSNDRFIRTTDIDHLAAATTMWQALEKNGFIYKAKYAGWYSVPDETFYTEEELVDGKSPDSGHPVEWVEEESYYFKLSAFGDKLLAYYEQNPDFIKPDSRRNEVMSFVKSGLKDLSISRSTFNWGVPVPGDDKHIMYVWIDALTNYLTATGWPDTTHANWKYWPAVHLVGKDILRFHAVYWPAMLMAADVPLPKCVFAHGWWTVDGAKMSKSKGNVIDPAQLVTEYGRDQVRYFLMREVPFGQDGDFSHARMIDRINKDLANDLGNLFQRVLSMVAKNCDGVVPEMLELSADDRTLLEVAKHLPAKVRDAVEGLAFNKALDAIWEVVSAGNRYMDSQKPWELKKTDPARMAHCLRVLIESFRPVSVVLEAFMPESAKRMQELVGVTDAVLELPSLAAGTQLPSPSGLFMRIQTEAA
ncbi:MAG: methionine--tRNA ligase [Proteobacteria bacterium]|nr:methionine--tRNA ligase [Pseudomonadota bacterium]